MRCCRAGAANGGLSEKGGNHVEEDDNRERDVTVRWVMGAARLKSNLFRPWWERVTIEVAHMTCG